jgi:hypothetical protein
LAEGIPVKKEEILETMNYKYTSHAGVAELADARDSKGKKSSFYKTL